MIFFITYFAIIIIDIKDLFKSNCNSSLSGIDDKKIFTLNQIKGININKYELPSDFIDLNRKLKNELIFTKENIEKYKYKLNINQIQLIKNINDIRNQNKIPGLIYNEELPDFIINEKTKLFFYPNENIYKISNNLYLFKYKKNEFQNFLKNKEILNIITIDLLSRINIIEQKNMEIISIFNGNINKSNNKINNTLNNDINISNKNINIKIPNINIKIPDINNINTEDKLKYDAVCLTMSEIGDDEKSENNKIKNIKIKKNAFEK